MIICIKIIYINIFIKLLYNLYIKYKDTKIVRYKKIFLTFDKL